jgi:hypothetical protein
MRLFSKTRQASMAGTSNDTEGTAGAVPTGGVADVAVGRADPMPSESSAISAPSTALRPKGAADGFQIWQHALLGKVAELTRALAKAPAGSIDYKGTRNWTPLFAASARGHTECVALLLKSNADPDIKADTGWTALMTAAQQGFADIASLLVEHGAATNVLNPDGNSAHALAVAAGKSDTASLLLKGRTGAPAALIDRGSSAIDPATDTAIPLAVEDAASEKAAKEAAAATKVQAIQRGNVARQAPKTMTDASAAAPDSFTEANTSMPPQLDTFAKQVAELSAELARTQAELASVKEQVSSPGLPALRPPEDLAYAARLDVLSKTVDSLAEELARERTARMEAETHAKAASEKAAKEAAAATKVQALQRGNVAREQQVSTARERAARMEAETHAKAASEKAAKEAAAATKVQAIQRGNVAREQQVSTARERAARMEAETHAKAASEKAAKEAAAATKVQAIQRGNVARQAPHTRAEAKAAAEKEAAEARAAAEKAAAEARAAAAARVAAEEAAAEAKLVAQKEAAEAAAAVTAVCTVNALPDDSWIKAQVSRTGSPARRASPRRKDAQEAQLNQVMCLVMDEATELATRLTQEIADLRGEMAALKAASAASTLAVETPSRPDAAASPRQPEDFANAARLEYLTKTVEMLAEQIARERAERLTEEIARERAARMAAEELARERAARMAAQAQSSPPRAVPSERAPYTPMHRFAVEPRPVAYASQAHLAALTDLVTKLPPSSSAVGLVANNVRESLWLSHKDAAASEPLLLRQMDRKPGHTGWQPDGKGGWTSPPAAAAAAAVPAAAAREGASDEASVLASESAVRTDFETSNLAFSPTGGETQTLAEKINSCSSSSSSPAVARLTQEITELRGEMAALKEASAAASLLVVETPSNPHAAASEELPAESANAARLDALAKTVESLAEELARERAARMEAEAQAANPVHMAALSTLVTRLSPASPGLVQDAAIPEPLMLLQLDRKPGHSIATPTNGRRIDSDNVAWRPDGKGGWTREAPIDDALISYHSTIPASGSVWSIDSERVPLALAAEPEFAPHALPLPSPYPSERVPLSAPRRASFSDLLSGSVATVEVSGGHGHPERPSFLQDVFSHKNLLSGRVAPVKSSGGNRQPEGPPAPPTPLEEVWIDMTRLPDARPPGTPLTPFEAKLEEVWTKVSSTQVWKDMFRPD